MQSRHLPEIMGVINCTPDSFFSRNRSENAGDAIEIGMGMIAQGADILDIGGESTRPGAGPVDAAEQVKRTVPVVEGLRQKSTIPISIDTSNAEVAQAAIEAGANIVNDTSALRADERMSEVVSRHGVKVVLMHRRGIPLTMQNNPRYKDTVKEVHDSLEQSVKLALAAGIPEKNIILDPGIGFGKRLIDNRLLLGNIDSWRMEGFPVLIGLSRKSFLGEILEGDNAITGSKRDFTNPANRLNATLAAHAWCISKGVDILRVHDVEATRQLTAVWESLEWIS